MAIDLGTISEYADEALDVFTGGSAERADEAEAKAAKARKKAKKARKEADTYKMVAIGALALVILVAKAGG